MLLVGLVAAVAILMILSAVAVQNWSDVLRRDREADMMFRAQEIVRAIRKYQRDKPGAPLTELKLLMEPGSKRQFFLRKLYTDPLVKDGKWGLLYAAPQGGVYDPSTEGGPAGAGQPGVPGAPGAPSLGGPTAGMTTPQTARPALAVGGLGPPRLRGRRINPLQGRALPRVQGQRGIREVAVHRLRPRRSQPAAAGAEAERPAGGKRRAAAAGRGASSHAEAARGQLEPPAILRARA